MNIIKLQAENFKRLKAVSIEPKGSVVNITGKNAQGKSSVLDSIWFALQNPGKGEFPAPIRNGEKTAKVTLELQSMIVERKTNASGSVLTITNKDGAVYKSPQAMLDALIGINLDPLEFKNYDEKKQLAMLLQISGLGDTLDKLDEKRKALYDERTYTNRKLAEAKAKLPAVMPTKIERVSVTELVKQAQSLQSQQQARESIKTEIIRYETEIGQIKSEMAKLQKRLDAGNKALEQKRSDLNLLPEVVGEEVNDINKKISGAESINRQADQFDECQAMLKQYNELDEKSKEKTAEIEKVDIEKEAAIKGANMPIPGLQFQNGAVYYNDVPLKQASDSEQIKVCIAIASATIPRDGIRVLRIKNASLLDSENMAVLEQMANDLNFQAWIETVDESGKIGIVIEDGMVK